PAEFPLPRSPARWGFALLAPRARRERDCTTVRARMQGQRARIADMARRLPWLPLGLAALVLLAGCGSAKKFSLAKTRPCLSTQPGVQLVPIPKGDFIARTALGSALAVELRHNEVTISFGLDNDEAQRLATAYRRF